MIRLFKTFHFCYRVVFATEDINVTPFFILIASSFSLCAEQVFSRATWQVRLNAIVVSTNNALLVEMKSNIIK